jgi:hypothetical protein
MMIGDDSDVDDEGVGAQRRRIRFAAGCALPEICAVRCSAFWFGQDDFVAKPLCPARACLEVSGKGVFGKWGLQRQVTNILLMTSFRIRCARIGSKSSGLACVQVVHPLLGLR